MGINSIKVVGLFLYLILATGLANAKNVTDPKTNFIKEATNAFEVLVKQNHKNDLEGKSHLNSYVINVGSPDNTIEQREGTVKGYPILENNHLTDLDNSIKHFNLTTVKTKEVGLYVILINNWLVLLDIRVPEGVQFEDLDEMKVYLNKQRHDQIEAIKKDVSDAINLKAEDLKKAGYANDVYVYLYGRIITSDYHKGDIGSPKTYNYYINHLGTSKTTAQKDFEMYRKNMLGIKSVMQKYATHYERINENVKKFAEVYINKDNVNLAHKTTNEYVSSWYNNNKIKETSAFSTESSVIVFDYTGIFNKEKNRLIEQLQKAKANAKVIVTDNSTESNIIFSIRSELAKTKKTDVYWVHLDPNGSIETEAFYRDDFLQLGTNASNLGNVTENLKGFVGQFFNKNAPNIIVLSHLTDFLDWESRLFNHIGSFLSQARIDRIYWDVQSTENLFTPVKSFVPKIVLEPFQNNFALVCGAWNAVIDNMQMITSGLNLVVTLQKECLNIILDPAYALEVMQETAGAISYIKNEWDNLKILGGVLIEIGLEKAGKEIVSVIQQELNRLTAGNVTGVYYLTGYLAVEVIIDFYTAGIAAEVKGAVYSLKAMKAIMQMIEPAVKLVAKFKGKSVALAKLVTRKAVFILKANGKIIINGTSEAAQVLFKQGDELIASILPNGNMVVHQSFNSLDEIVEELPIPNNLIRASTPEGKVLTNLHFRATKDSWGFVDKLDNVVDLETIFGTKYKQLWPTVSTYSDDLKNAFHKDFCKEMDDVMLSGFIKDPGQLDAWEIIQKGGFTTYTKDPVLLKGLSDLVKTNTSGWSKDDFIKALKDNPDIGKPERKASDIIGDILILLASQVPSPEEGSTPEEPKEEEKKKQGCTVCKQKSEVVCRLWEQVRDKAVRARMGNTTANIAADKICREVANEITLEKIAVLLITYNDNNVKLFLEDVIAEDDNTNALSKNVNVLNSDLVKAWKKFTDHRLLRTEISFLNKVNEFVESGFLESYLDRLSKIMNDMNPHINEYKDRSDKVHKNLTRDENFVKFADKILSSMMIAKVKGYATSFGIEVDVIKQLEMVITSNKLKNLDELDYFVYHMERETKTTPGDLVHLNEVVDRIKKGHEVYMESNVPGFKADIVDLNAKEYIELKGITSEADDKVKDNIKAAMDQVLGKNTLENMQKVSMVNVLNPQNPVFNKSKTELSSWLESYYYKNRRNPVGTQLKQLDIIRIKNNTGIHDYKINAEGKVITVN